MLYTHVPDISCFYSDAADDAIFLPAAHFEYEMILVTHGQAQAVINHKTYDLKPRSLIFISRMERHNFLIKETPYCRYVASMSSNLIMSHMKEPELMSIFIQRPKEFSHAIELDKDAYQIILPLFRQMAAEYTARQDFYVTSSISLFISILIALYRTNAEYFPMRSHSTMSDAVLDAQKYISDNYHRKLTLQEIADKNFVSRHALSLAFKDIAGITFKEYLLLFRMTEAKKLLITTDLPISRVAERVGYINVNNFVKLFREREQITPLQYRKQYS